jgi:hypothetical protein
VTGTMLPDILPYDPTCPASFPENGRALIDGAADAFLSILTNGKVTRDKVGPHGDLLAGFPYLVYRLANNGDVVAFKMGRRQGARRAHI